MRWVLERWQQKRRRERLLHRQTRPKMMATAATVAAVPPPLPKLLVSLPLPPLGIHARVRCRFFLPMMTAALSRLLILLPLVTAPSCEWRYPRYRCRHRVKDRRLLLPL